MLTSHGHSHGSGSIADGLLPQHVQDVSVDFSGGYELSPETKPRLKLSAQLKKWLKAILQDPATRNLFFFLCLNLSFAFVELLYGMWTNSLGLISDSFHMFFDCTALLAGLVAALVAKWAANERFSYGYVRAEVIAGFVNALFLLFISFFIFSEAIERAFEPPEVKHDRLLIISIAGFVVNLIGIFVFHHGGAGHGHSHGGGSHGHSHGGGSHGHSHGHAHDHSHSHGTNNHIHAHSHSHGGSQLMHGIFLHILADTLGSVGVIISSTLIYMFDWMLADPICSMFIAVLIMMSVYPLMNESLGVLMQRSPLKTDGILPQSLQRITELEGVVEVRDTHFWTLCTGTYLGSMRLDIQQGSDPTHLVAVARSILKQTGLTDVIIEVTVID